jgi:prepilin-type N-terminal cleavage/methylation domain-containing protein
MKGFTLVEVLAASVILAVLMVALFLVLGLGQRSWIRGDVNIQLQQEISRALVVMARELKETAPKKVSISPSDTIKFNIPQDLNGDGSVIDSVGAIEWSPDITYSLNGSNQITRTFNGATSIIANNISALQFALVLNEDSVVRIDITASKISNAGQLVQDNGETIVKMRNE